MSVMSDYKRKAVLNNWFNNTAPPVPATIYVGVGTAAWLTSDTGSTAGREPVGNGYARVAVSTSGGFTAPSYVGSSWQISNVADINFPQDTTTNWGTIADAATFDAATAGNLLDFGVTTSSQLIVVGAYVKIPAGSLVISLT